jgi:hypothetical protein
VYLLAAGTTGYGGKGIAASSANASISLLNAASTGFSDSLGAYVLTDSNGDFSISNDYTCTSGEQLYLYALGGQPLSGIPNSAAGFLAVVGACPAAGNFAALVPFVTVNEVSTVAAAYAFAGFATDALHVSSGGSALAQTGIANAFASASNLASLATGSALATTPMANGGNGTVPQSSINTLGNILSACVNSSGPGSTNCASLFANAETAGTTGTAPTDTATAAINIAHNPGMAITALFALQPGIGAPFSPQLATQPNDFTLALQFTGGGLYQPGPLAVDASGNVWIPNSAHSNVSSLTELSPVGAPISPSTGFLNVVNNPLGIAIDTSGYIWVTNWGANFTNPSVSKITPSGTAAPSSPFTGGGLANPTSIGFDAVGNVWVGDEGGKVSEFNDATGAPVVSAGYTDPLGNSGLAYVAIDTQGDAWVSSSGGQLNDIYELPAPANASSTFTPNAVDSQGPLAFDAAGNLWIAGLKGATTKLNGSGTAAASSPFTGGGQCGSCAEGIAVDGAGNVWISDGPFLPNEGNVNLAELDNSGVAVSPATGYQSSLLTYPIGVAIDGSGNVWVGDNGGSDVVEFVGAAVPVVTPLAAGVVNKTLGSRP